MTRKLPVPLTGEQRAFDRALVENGGHTTVGAVLEEIVDLLGGLLEREASKSTAPREPPGRGPEAELVPAQGKDRRVSRATAANRRSPARPPRAR